MAEIFGVVAGGVALAEVAVKLGRHTLGLKQLWGDIKDVPTTIQSLTEDICLLEPVIGEMEESLYAQQQHMTSVQIVTYCRKALRDLEASVDELTTEINSKSRFDRGKRKIKISLQSNFWTKHQTRLQRVIQMLSLALSCYQILLIQEQPKIILSQLETSKRVEESRHGEDSGYNSDRSNTNTEKAAVRYATDIQSRRDMFKSPLRWLEPSIFGGFAIESTESDDMSIANSAKETPAHFMTRQRQYVLQLRFPSWLTRKAWDLLLSSSYTGFTHNLRVYSIVPADAPVFRLARSQDWKGLLHLFNQDLASPFDRTEEGETILDVAVRSGNIELASKATEWGLEISSLFNPSLESLFWHQSFGALQEAATVQSLHELVLRRGAYDDFADIWVVDNGSATNDGNGTRSLNYFMLKFFVSAIPKAMQLMLPHLRPNHYRLPAIRRLSFFWFDDRDADAYSLLFALQSSGVFCQEDIQELDSEGFSLIKLLARQYKTGLVWDSIPTFAKGELSFARWRMLARNIMEVTDLLHDQSVPGVWHIGYGITQEELSITPLLALVLGVPTDSPYNWSAQTTFKTWRRLTDLCLRYWLEDLQTSAVDLALYGEKENIIFSANKASKPKQHKLYYNIFLSDDKNHETAKLCSCGFWVLEGFTFGPDPRDWHLSWDMAVESFVGQFWDTIENPWRSMPGAWQDD